jgi:phenylpyruvate tautomerase PptA (4-oxalocrotonate tautomerase family)
VSWLAWLGTALGSLLTIRQFIRWVYRPIRRFFAELLGGVRSAATSAHELAQLAGAVTHVVVALTGRVHDVEDTVSGHQDRLDTLAELLTDALADIHHLKEAG